MILVSRIKGIPVTLYEKTQTGTDENGMPVYTETPVTVDNVLVGEPTADDLLNEHNLTGKRIAYVLAVPKGDSHEWANRTVEFFGQKFRTVGVPTQGIDELIPLDWNKKVKVEAYE